MKKRKKPDLATALEFIKSQGEKFGAESLESKDEIAALKEEASSVTGLTVKLEKAKVAAIKKVAVLGAKGIAAGEEQALIAELRAELDRRAYKGQRIFGLMLEEIYMLPKATASRYAAIILYAALKKRPFNKLGGFIKKHGGLVKCAAKASRAFRGENDAEENEGADFRFSLTGEVKSGIFKAAKSQERIYVSGVIERDGKSLKLVFVKTEGTRETFIQWKKEGVLTENAYGRPPLMMLTTSD